MIAREFIKDYWQYYIELEKQVVDTQRYVSFDPNNYDTFSMEYIKLLQIICSEIDVVGKAIGQHYNTAFIVDKNININKWGYQVQKAFPTIQTKRVLFWNGIELTPWNRWKYILNEKGTYPILDAATKAKTPFWWNAYNGIKHQRTAIGPRKRPNYMRANLKAVINSLAALYIMEKLMLDCFHETDVADVEKSRVFRMI